ncbi:MAG: CDP-diacylglycerol--glycerol-3-phosphate 3-phosphatidyltransferase [Clostridia bacterium]|nr:CDP-diacylglycerol--glycerol-3-phosphate 3-phosphatidyltransferase [Clostridia bacterium]
MQGEGENRLLTIPNLLTVFRILLVPFFVITFYQYPEKRYYSLGVFALASFTDGIDGYLARRLNQITNFGKLVDPVADKLMIICMLFCLKYVGLLAPGKKAWLNNAILYTIFAKELFMMGGGVYMLKKGVVVHSNYIGKSATAMFVLAILLVFPGNVTAPWHGVVWLQNAGLWLMLVATLLSFIALVVYVRNSVKTLKAH